MRKIWLIATTTYKRQVRSGAFLILTFVLPGLMVTAGAIPFVTSGPGRAPQAVGYVDQTGQLAPPQAVRVEAQTLQLKAYANPEAARRDYEQGEIAGYLVVPAGYFEGARPRYYAEEPPATVITEGLSIALRRAMLPDAPEWLLERLADPAHRTFVAADSGETIEEGLGLVLRIVAPAALSLLLGLALLFTAGQMGAAVVREKDQRAMEIIVTSLRPSELVAGKVLGMSMLSLTQLAVWAGGGLIGLALLAAGQVDLAGVNAPWKAIFWAAALGVPGYFLYAVLAAGLGVIAGSSQQAQQLAAFLGFIGMVPFWLAGALVSAPNSAIAVGLTLFPLTAPMFSLLRMAVTEVPLWQLVASAGILIASLAAAMWAVARIFRAAMLMYGQALSPRMIARAIRQA
jgi:ABC-2 type transport system permease protein